MTSVEQEILIYCTLLRPDLGQQQRIGQLMGGVKDRNLLIDTAIKEGLVSMLYKSLLNAGALDTLDIPQKERLQSLYYQVLVHNLRLIYDLKEILHELNRREVPVVLLQGIILLQQIYHDVGLRPMTDIDLWVREVDYPDFVEILGNKGYQRDPLYPNTFRKGPTILDVHTHILWADRIKTRTFLLAKSQDYIYHQTRVIDFEGESARSLGTYDQVLYLCLHALKHNVERLMWLVDIKGLVAHWEGSDWKALMDRATEWGQEKSLAYILSLLSHVFGFHPPPDACQLPGREGFNLLERKALKQRVRKGALPRWAPLLLFSPANGLKNRASFIFETLFPRPEILRQIFEDSPDLKVWQLYCMRILQLLGKVKMCRKGL